MIILSISSVLLLFLFKIQFGIFYGGAKQIFIYKT